MQVTDIIKEMYPEIEWDKFEDIDRALNWELWNGPLPDDYWFVAEPLENYQWEGWTTAVRDISDILEPLPHEMWYDHDWDGVYLNNPADDDEYWIEEDGEYIYTGPEYITKFDPREKLMFEETYSYVF